MIFFQAVAIKIQFETLSLVGLRNRVLDVGAHWRHLANTTEPSVCGGDAALCQITLTSYYYVIYMVLRLMQTIQT